MMFAVTLALLNLGSPLPAYPTLVRAALPLIQRHPNSRDGLTFVSSMVLLRERDNPMGRFFVRTSFDFFC
jgi:hypothetical protein